MSSKKDPSAMSEMAPTTTDVDSAFIITGIAPPSKSNSGTSAGIDGIDRDPMIGEHQVRLGFHSRHVAGGAGAAGDGGLVFRRRVAVAAGEIVRGRPPLRRTMRGMTGQAAQVGALPETRAGCEHERLVPGVPWIGKIEAPLRRRLAMALAAQIV